MGTSFTQIELEEVLFDEDAVAEYRTVAPARRNLENMVRVIKSGNTKCEYGRSQLKLR